MSTEATVKAIVSAETWAQRIQQLRLVPARHGTDEYTAIYAAVARELYIPHLSPDFAYIHESSFYETTHFFIAYDEAARLTEDFLKVDEASVARAMFECPRTLMVFRTLIGLTKDEFSHATVLVADPENLPRLSSSQIDSMERSAIPIQRSETKVATKKAQIQALVAAKTIDQVISGTLFGVAPPGLKVKQNKPDTEAGWESVRQYATNGVPLKVFLHQRHYGGAFRQVLDATSTARGDLIEDAVAELFRQNEIQFIRTGSHNQAEVARRFEVHVTPAPDFVVFDPVDDSLKAILECKGTNNGGTARDKALRFRNLNAESLRLGGVPLFAVLGGIGWARINDALGPVIRDTTGRVFTLSTLPSMMEVAPFTSLARQR